MGPGIRCHFCWEFPCAFLDPAESCWRIPIAPSLNLSKGHVPFAWDVTNAVSSDLSIALLGILWGVSLSPHKPRKCINEVLRRDASFFFSRLPSTDIALIDSLLHVHSLLDADMEGLSPQQADGLILEYLNLPPDHEDSFKAFLGAHEMINALGDARASGTNFVWLKAVTTVCDKGGVWELLHDSMKTDSQRGRLERLEEELDKSRRKSLTKRGRGSGPKHTPIEMDDEVRP